MRVSILAESADLADEIDIDQARADLESVGDDEDERARALGRLRAAGQRD